MAKEPRAAAVGWSIYWDNYRVFFGGKWTQMRDLCAETGCFRWLIRGVGESFVCRSCGSHFARTSGSSDSGDRMVRL